MKVLLQRVTRARVSVAGSEVGAINKGMVIFIGVRHEDTAEMVRRMADKIVHLRIFEDQQGKTNLSSLDVDAEILVVSQFTLYADCRRGRRPGFSHAAGPEIAEPLYELMAMELASYSLRVVKGVFAAHMLVEIFNDGPFTILLDSSEQ